MDKTEEYTAFLEKSTKIYIDSILSKSKKPISVESLLNELRNCPQHIRNYINITNQIDLIEFLNTRAHFWKMMGNLVGKQPEELGQVLLQILNYVSGQCQKWNDGAKLGDVSSMMGSKCSKFRKQLGKGLEVVETLLLKYPALFIFHPYSQSDDSEDSDEEDLSDLLVINIGAVVNSVIMPVGTHRQHNPAYLDGTGVIIKIFHKSYGFIRDDLTEETVHFRINLARNIPQNNLRVGQTVYFRAVISQMYKRGDTDNKWTAVSVDTADRMKNSKEHTPMEGVSDNDNSISLITIKQYKSEPFLSSTVGLDDNMGRVDTGSMEHWLEDFATRLSRLRDGPGGTSTVSLIEDEADNMSGLNLYTADHQTIGNVASRAIGTQTEPPNGVDIAIRRMTKRKSCCAIC